MITFFSPYPEFNQKVERSLISSMDEIISEFGMKAGYVNVIFLSDDELLKLNIDFLNHNYYTDIITFNYSEDPKSLEAELYISADRVRENAEANGVSLNEEVTRVVVHGMLHLAGFNDQTESEKNEMRQLEDKYMNPDLFHVKQDQEKTEV